MKTLQTEIKALVRQWQGDARHQEIAARSLRGAERSAAVAHGNTKSADANALSRLLAEHGEGAA